MQVLNEVNAVFWFADTKLHSIFKFDFKHNISMQQGPSGISELLGYRSNSPNPNTPPPTFEVSTMVASLLWKVRPHCAVMAACNFNRWQSIFTTFRFILSSTARLAPFPYGDRRVQGSAKAQRMPAMIAQADLDNLSRPVHTYTLTMRFNREYWSWWRYFHAWYFDSSFHKWILIAVSYRHKRGVSSILFFLQSSVIIVYLWWR